MSIISDICGMTKKPQSPPKKKKPQPAWAKRLQTARKMTTLNQTEFAKSIGLSQPRYSQYESGERKPPPDVLERLVKEHQISLNYVFGGEPDPRMIKRSDSTSRREQSA
jgi:transcriptional regulator with XRE-family HTH domain